MSERVRPTRIQRKRSRGWKMPEGAVYVGRPTRWGNPYAVGDLLAIDGVVRDASREDVVRLYRVKVERLLELSPDALKPLRGKDLACWCPLDQPCHADVLLELANTETPAMSHE